MSQFSVNTRLFYGIDRYLQLKDFLLDLHVDRIALVIDQVLSLSPVVNEIINYFSFIGAATEAPLFLNLEGEPTYSQLEKVVVPLRISRPNLLVAIGGGSILDLVKGIAVLLNNPGKATDYRGVNKVQNPSVPVIAVPSTAGTGAEVTSTASFIDDKSCVKLGINGKNVAPIAGLLEPRLLTSCPRMVAISAGLDVMVHAVEAVTARTSTLLTTKLGAQAFCMIYNSLPICLDAPDNLDAWTEAQLGAYLAGIVMMSASGGPASGISYPLGVHYGVPHGIAGGIFLSGVFDVNVGKGCTSYRKIYDLLPGATLSLDATSKAIEFAKLFSTFYDKIGAPRNLRQWNFNSEDDIAFITRLTMLQRKENLDLNPVPFSEKEVETVIRGVCR